MKRLLLFVAVAALLFSGCVQQSSCPAKYMKIGTDCCLDANSNGICDRDEGANATSAGAAGGAGQTGGAGSGTDIVVNGLSFSQWTAPDNSITLQVPQGWTAIEKQVDKCTVNWAVRNPAGTSSAFMNNQIMVFKSESARQMYKSYGLPGTDSAPVSGYLGAEQALSSVVAPLSGSTNVQITGRDTQSSAIFSRGVCISGLAACDAQVLDLTYTSGAVPMRAMYLVQSIDLGDGTTWWISIWGYEAPAAEWDSTNAVLQKTFSSVNYTSDWASKCGSVAGAADVIHEVVIERQKAADRAAQQAGR